MTTMKKLSRLEELMRKRRFSDSTHPVHKQEALAILHELRQEELERMNGITTRSRPETEVVCDYGELELRTMARVCFNSGKPFIPPDVKVENKSLAELYRFDASYTDHEVQEMHTSLLNKIMALAPNQKMVLKDQLENAKPGQLVFPIPPPDFGDDFREEETRTDIEAPCPRCGLEGACVCLAAG